ncbi:MAG TPA: molecular chaperone HtpG [Candidatus Fimenecus excrementavium]|nr:molecular chaperone HtpG [Candidatus Fimenecus excrementavium]
MAKKQFKTESKRMLDLMINSIYTNKEIFLRELISNASDAIDKLYFKSLTDQSVQMNRDDFKIDVSIDKANRLLKVCDNGIGMTEEELDKNLGTIAKSGSLQFTNENETDEHDVDIIGQFGVGFYAAFMVADRVEVVSRAYGSDKAFKWQSTGADGYTVTEAEKDTVGTEITLHIKESTEEADYDRFLDTYTISSLIKKYSDYIRFPIRMDMERSRLKEGSDSEYETYTENVTVNSMIPLWKKNKKDITKEEYEKFYQETFSAYDKPLRVIHQKAEGTTSYQALLFIPEKADYNYYSKNFEKGLALYSSGVKIMDKCADLLPDCFSFVKGVVDSEDLSLNISREMLQQDRQLKVIAHALEKKIKKELEEMLEKERETYERFWKAFGLQLKFALYSSFGAERDKLQDLLLFTRASDSKLCTLKEYRDAMPESQKYIYYAAGESAQKLALLPQAETVRDKGYDILYLTDDVDEFLMQILHAYDEKEFRSISSDDLGLESDEEKKEITEKAEANKDLFAAMQKALDGKVSEVVLSSKLKSHPVCLSSKGAFTIEMEKVIDAMPNVQQNAPKAQRVLEINGSHPVFNSLTAAFAAGDTKKVENYAKLLYDQALLIEGLSVEDPVAFSNAICELMQ